MISMYIPFKLHQLQVGDRLGEAKMLMALGESTTVTEGRAKAGRWGGSELECMAASMAWHSAVVAYFLNIVFAFVIWS